MNNIQNKLLYFLILITICSLQAKGQKFFSIPTQHLELYQLMGIEDDYHKDTIKAFEISDFITYKDYKKYLYSIKSDSSEQFYYTQLPDTNITIDKEVYQEYITSSDYDNFPVLGISWENAMNYCKWKTLKDNKKGGINFIYRLPMHSEWLAALNYYKTNKIKNDLNQKYSDWLLNTFDESAYNFARDFVGGFDFCYINKKNDPPSLKRKRIVGESYLYYIPKFRYGYSYIGYQQVAFRLVKTNVDEYILKYWEIEK